MAVRVFLIRRLLGETQAVNDEGDRCDMNDRFGRIAQNGCRLGSPPSRSFDLEHEDPDPEVDPTGLSQEDGILSVGDRGHKRDVSEFQRSHTPISRNCLVAVPAQSRFAAGLAGLG